MAQRAFKTIQMYKLPREEGKKKKKATRQHALHAKAPVVPAGCRLL